MERDVKRRQYIAACIAAVIITGTLLLSFGLISRGSLQVVSVRPRAKVVTSESGQGQPAALRAWLASLDASKHRSVIVTALYDIGRGAHGSTMATYRTCLVERSLSPVLSSPLLKMTA